MKNGLYWKDGIIKICIINENCCKYKIVDF